MGHDNNNCLVITGQQTEELVVFVCIEGGKGQWLRNKLWATAAVYPAVASLQCLFRVTVT